jgi:pyruvate-ferredoxin/flavodoxin oxidoreductase
MSKRKMITIDGNEAASQVAYRCNEVIAIYPITPSSPMGELCDELAGKRLPNIWGTVPDVIELQSEGGASGAVHGALQAGALSTTFTSSQGLLLMIPNMFKIAGELTSTVFHIAARSVACQGLSIFGDHSDVMAARSTGWGMLFSNNVQEVTDFALISQAVTLESRIPFLHAFDGFRTSHEVLKIESLSDDDIRAMLDDDLIAAHRSRALTPDRPVLRGTAQNPDVYFQARETVNPFYEKTPAIVEAVLRRFEKQVGRAYQLFDYVGAPDAERVIVMMGSGADTAGETVKAATAKGEKIGLVKVRLYRPFSPEHLLAAIPATAKTIAVLDRTKEPGGHGEPLFLDILGAISENMSGASPRFAAMPKITNGRYGLSSKEFTPAMVKGVFDEMKKAAPKPRFTIGIIDDVTHLSLDYDASYSIESDKTIRAVFWGLGADGTVGANKNSIKIIGEETPNFAQGYFVYDSKKSGAVTVSHLRFGPDPIHHPYLISHANFVAVHQFVFVETYPVLALAQEGATFLLNSEFGPEEVWNRLPISLQKTIIEKKIKFYVIDAYKVAAETHMGVRINTIMQTCFFHISGVLPPVEAVAKIKEAIEKTYGKRGAAVVNQNNAAVDAAVSNLREVKVPSAPTATWDLKSPVPAEAPEFVRNVTAELMAFHGDQLPVSAFPADGTYPTATTKWEKRNIALDAPSWVPELCIQCGKCVFVCPHGCLRAKMVDEKLLAGAPPTLKSAAPKVVKGNEGKRYLLQTGVEDCTGCTLCVVVCPAKDKTDPNRKARNMEPQRPIREQERANWDFFLKLPETSRAGGSYSAVNTVQYLDPLFEFSGACAGCGETPYINYMTRLFGDRMVVANATGCSSIYGGNLPTTPYSVNNDGRGPAWSNSLFEDNAEFGLGMRLAIDKQDLFARDLIGMLGAEIGDELVAALLNADQSTEAGIAAQRERVAELKKKLAGSKRPEAARLLKVADYLVKKSVWCVGGDGWAYDIGYGGLDHVLASGRNVNVLVLDTEVYSNTGGQASKSTPLGASAKFAVAGKSTPKKDLGLMAMNYGSVYVASVAFGANDAQTVKAFLEAEAWNGPSIIIAYSHCIAHGIDMAKGLDQQRKAVESGHWILYRYNPALALEGKNPLQIDSREPKIPLKDYIYTETRYMIPAKSHPEAAARYLEEAQAQVKARWEKYQRIAGKDVK